MSEPDEVDPQLRLLLQEAEASGVPEYPDGFWERLWRFSLILLGGVVVAALLAWAVGAFRPQKF